MQYRLSSRLLATLQQQHPIFTSTLRLKRRHSNHDHLKQSYCKLEPKMSTSARRRLMRDFKVQSPLLSEFITNQNLTEIQRMQTDPPAGVSASPIQDNVMIWYVSSPSTLHEVSTLQEPSKTYKFDLQECRHHRPSRHPLRRWHIPPRDALRRAIPE